MSRTYKTARGKILDMDAIKLANETTTAVGNMKVNARGDILGAGGKIVAGRNQVMDNVYAVPPASTSSGGYSPDNGAVVVSAQPPVIAEEPVSPVVEQTTTEQSAKTRTRGSLASSVAKKG